MAATQINIRKTGSQSRMNNPETLATLDTYDTRRRQSKQNTKQNTTKRTKRIAT
jgi:hypothetical protein